MNWSTKLRDWSDTQVVLRAVSPPRPSPLGRGETFSSSEHNLQSSAPLGIARWSLPPRVKGKKRLRAIPHSEDPLRHQSWRVSRNECETKFNLRLGSFVRSLMPSAFPGALWYLEFVALHPCSRF